MQELDRVEIEGFDKKTGKRNIQLLCPSRLCGHRGIGCTYKDRTLLQMIFGPPLLCIKCGRKKPSEDYI